jgi:Cu2+-containing amine oxidase
MFLVFFLLALLIVFGRYMLQKPVAEAQNQAINEQEKPMPFDYLINNKVMPHSHVDMYCMLLDIDIEATKSVKQIINAYNAFVAKVENTNATLPVTEDAATEVAQGAYEYLVERFNYTAYLN